MSAAIYLITLGVLFGTIALVFGMRSWAAIQQAKARLGGEEAYKQLADKAAATQTETAATLASISETLADVRTRLAAVETILKAVE